MLISEIGGVVVVDTEAELCRMSARRFAKARCLAIIFAAWFACELQAVDLSHAVDPQQFAAVSHPWGVLTSQLLLTSPVESAQIPLVALSLSTDGRKMATVDRKSTIRLYDTVDAKLLHTIAGSKRNISNLTFSPDAEHLVTVGLDSAITTWNVKSGVIESEFAGAPGWILGVVFSPSGKFIVTGGYNKKPQVWDPLTGIKIKSLDSASAIRDLAISQDGTQLVAGCVDGEIRTWHTNDWTRSGISPRVPFPLNAVAYSPDGSCIAAGGDGGEIRLWNAVDGHELGTLQLHSSQITNLQFSPQGKTLFSCASNGDVAVWDVAEKKLLQIFSQHRDEVTGLAWLPHHRAIVTIGADGAQRVRFAHIPAANVKALGGTVATWTALSTDGQLLIATNGKGEIRITDLSQDNQTKTITAPSATRCMTVTASDHLLAAGVDRRLRQWDLATASLLTESQSLDEDATCLDVATNGQRLVIGTVNRTIQFLDISNVSQPTVRWTSPPQTLSLSCISFSPDDKIIATSTRDPESWRVAGEVKLWDSETGKEIVNLGLHGAEVLGLCFDTEGQRLATFGSFYDVRLWDVANKKELPPLSIRAYTVGASFSHDNKRMIIAQNNGPVSIWSIQRQMPIREFEGHNSSIAALVVSQSAKVAVTRDVTNHAKVWKVPDE